MGDVVANVGQAVAELDDKLAELIKLADDPEGAALAQLLYDVQAARVGMQRIEAELERQTAKAMMGDQLVTPTLRVERRRTKDRKTWDHEQWQADVRTKLLRKHNLLRCDQVVTEDGELREVNLHQLLADVETVHGAGAPKVTQLRALGLDPDDYCETQPGRLTVQVQQLADETEGGE